MIVIGICDADTAVRVMLSDYIKRYREETNLGVQILSYDSGEKLMHHYPFEMDLIFLEIPFERMNGLEIAKRIRKADPKVSIVFLTSMLNFVLEAYQVRADNYLMKPLKYSRFLEEIENSRERHGKDRFFLETNTDGIFKVYTKSICYIETVGQNTLIHTETGSILSHKRMKEHEQVLYERYFVRCHSGFIINLLFFDKIIKDNIFLSNSDSIPLSRHRRKDVINKIDELYKEELANEKD